MKKLNLKVFVLGTLTSFALIHSSCNGHKGSSENSISHKSDSIENTSVSSSNQASAEKKSCEAGFKTISTQSLAPIMRSVRTESHKIVLKAEWKYGRDSHYYLTHNCFSADPNCKRESGWITFGRQSNSFGLDGIGLIELNGNSSQLYDAISFDRLDELQLYTSPVYKPAFPVDAKVYGGDYYFQPAVPVTQSSILDYPSPESHLAFTPGHHYVWPGHKKGDAFLILVFDPMYHHVLELYKLKVEEVNQTEVNQVTKSESLELTYEKIAEASQDDVWNYYCSKRAELLKTASNRSQGEGVLYHRDFLTGFYSTIDGPSFDFEFGLNNFESRFIGSDGTLKYENFTARGKILSPEVYLNDRENDRILDLGTEYSLDSLDRRSIHELEPINTRLRKKMGIAQSSEQFLMHLNQDHVYLIHQRNDELNQFVAFQVKEIHPSGSWVKISWKRVTISI